MKTAPFRLQVDDGSHRQSDWLELFFDLAFVICIAALSHQLAHEPGAILSYIGYFVPVWWIWNQFTWYSAHFNNSDGLFRIFMFSGIAGTLVLAAGLQSHDAQMFVLAYLFLHAILFAGWMRAYRHIHLYRPYIKLKSTGIVLGLAFWTASLFFTGTTQVALWIVGTTLQLALPIFAWATVKEMITVHLTHLTERHGLFTIIVLGECLVSLVSGLAKSPDYFFLGFWFLMMIGIWWVYFKWDAHAVEMKGLVRTFTYNYGHFAIYCTLGVVAAGVNGHSYNMASAGLALFLIVLIAMEWITKRGGKTP